MVDITEKKKEKKKKKKKNEKKKNIDPILNAHNSI